MGVNVKFLSQFYPIKSHHKKLNFHKNKAKSDYFFAVFAIEKPEGHLPLIFTNEHRFYL